MLSCGTTSFSSPFDLLSCPDPNNVGSVQSVLQLPHTRILYKYVSLADFQDAFVNRLRLGSLEAASCASDLQRKCPHEKTAEGIRCPSSPKAILKGGLEWELSEAKHSKTGGRAHSTSKRALRRSGCSGDSVCYSQTTQECLRD